jgi:hypothetical protein
MSFRRIQAVDVLCPLCENFLRRYFAMADDGVEYASDGRPDPT